MTIQTDYILTHFNTFRLPAKCKYFITCETVQELKKLSADEYFRTLPFTLIGQGSNLLFTQDFEGALVHMSNNEVEFLSEDNEGNVLIKVGAGKCWDKLVEEVCLQNLWGMENLSLIPGDTGAAAAQNIGAYGVEIESIVKRVHTVNLATGEECIFTRTECDYKYRHSIFKTAPMNYHVIYAVEFLLKRNGCPNLSYFKTLEEGTSPSTPTDIRNLVIQTRQQKLPDPEVLPNAGSFFTNPVLPADSFKALTEKIPNIPYYAQQDGYKIPAAWLIEQCGYKGKVVGNVGCHKNQPLVIINTGNATGHEIETFSQQIQQEVLDKFGIRLQPEVRTVSANTLTPIAEAFTAQ